jgi:2-methylisocitrate lyase-like PEP mutase family enzyme
VQEYEKTGVAVLHIEDQAFPKRCGHFDGKAVIPVADMVAKIYAACNARRDDDFVLIVRTDALAVTGLDDTLRRCVAYAQVGADVLCLEALRHQDDIDRVRRELQALRCKIIIFPGGLMLSVRTLARRVWREIREHGTTTNLLGDMVGVQDFFEITGLQELLTLDARWEG